jgi:hypothetical protein
MPSSKYLVYFFLFLIASNLAGCQKFENNEDKQSSINVTRLDNTENSFGIYESSITQVNDTNKQAWVNMPKPNLASNVPIERLSELLVEVNCKHRSLKVLKSTDINGKDLELATSQWDIPSPKDAFYPIVQYLCSNTKS